MKFAIMKTQVLATLAVILCSAAPSHARETVSSLQQTFSQPSLSRTLFDGKFDSAMRVSVIGSGISQGTNSQGTGGSLHVGVDFGRGWLGGEIGLGYLMIPTNLKIQNGYGASYASQNIMLHYAGLSLLGKYNYIEDGPAALSIKVGVMPSMLMSAASQSLGGGSSGWVATVDVPQSDVLMLAGFTGTSPINEWSSFVLDGTFFRGVSDLDGAGSTHQGFQVGAGLQFHM